MGPEWIKLFPEEILGKAEMVALSDDQLGKLIRLWAIASKEGCCIPSDLGMVASMLRAPSPESLEWVRRFFRPCGDPDQLMSQRLHQEMEAYNSKCMKNRESGAQGGKRKAANRQVSTVANAKQTLERTLSKRSSENLADTEEEVTSLRSVTTEPSLRSDASAPKLLVTDEPTVDQAQHLVDHWNATCGPAGLPKVLKLDPKRRAAIKARLKDPEWPVLFREACAFIAHHPGAAWMRGQGDRQWKAALDFILRPGEVERTVEKARAAGPAAAGSARASPHQARTPQADQALREQVAGMNWPSLSTAAGAP